jgi:hypothetical protein
VSRLGLALALPTAQRAARLPAVALLGGAVLCLVHTARLAPRVDGAAAAASLATAQAWWLAALLAAALPAAAVRAAVSGGTPHIAPLGRLHAAPIAALAVTATTGVLTLAAGLVPLLLAAEFGGGRLIVRGLAPGAGCLATVVVVAAIGGRLTPARQLVLHYAALAAMAGLLLWRPPGW